VGHVFADGESMAAPRPAVAEMLEARYREIGREHATGDWHLLAHNESVELVALIRSHDLAIIGQNSPNYRLPSGFRPGDLVLACGRPLLVTPYAGSFATIGRRVLIAWDGTREATRGLHDALPLIAKAELAVVMTVRPDEESFSRDASGLGRIVRHLERHGILARPEEAPQADIPIADVLLSRAADLDIDLIVAGAFHHSQIREAVFGGVSRELLDHTTVPLLLSH
jgi:nucleotide-binding universal stress UspA family protein